MQRYSAPSELIYVKEENARRGTKNVLINGVEEARRHLNDVSPEREKKDDDDEMKKTSLIPPPRVLTQSLTLGLVLRPMIHFVHPDTFSRRGGKALMIPLIDKSRLCYLTHSWKWPTDRTNDERPRFLRLTKSSREICWQCHVVWVLCAPLTTYYVCAKLTLFLFYFFIYFFQGNLAVFFTDDDDDFINSGLL